MARRVSKVASTGARAAPAICVPISCMTAPALAAEPNAWLSESSLVTSAPTLEAMPAMGPLRLSIMFITSDSLNTDSKLMCFTSWGRLPSLGKYLDDRLRDDIHLQLLDKPGLRQAVQELVESGSLRVKPL